MVFELLEGLGKMGKKVYTLIGTETRMMEEFLKISSFS